MLSLKGQNKDNSVKINVSLVANLKMKLHLCLGWCIELKCH